MKGIWQAFITKSDDTQCGILTTWPSNYFKGHYITLYKYYYTERQAIVKYVCHGNGRWKKKTQKSIVSNLEKYN